jgi:pSer/pThr/pTyr-binding forkhead associated (FHA) protein
VSRPGIPDKARNLVRNQESNPRNGKVKEGTGIKATDRKVRQRTRIFERERKYQAKNRNI